ncbi:hypothetical protein NL676_036370 [Syzygium grande]|nr:hypothetical protein NL676_036370 [Syzygium grande]
MFKPRKSLSNGSQLLKARSSFFNSETSEIRSTHITVCNRGENRKGSFHQVQKLPVEEGHGCNSGEHLRAGKATGQWQWLLAQI